MPSPAQRAELGPMTLFEVHAARNGSFRSESLPKVKDRPLVTSLDERGTPTAGAGRPLELREQTDTERVFEGHASTYGVEYEMFGGPPWGWIESVERGAGAKSLAGDPDVVFLVNHAGLPLARTASGTLELSEDNLGLRDVARLDASDPDVDRLVPKIERGDLSEQSFAFRIVRQEWDEDYERRWITEYSIERGDVSIVTFGANPHTDAHLRFADQLLGGIELVELVELSRQADTEAELRELRAKLDQLLDGRDDSTAELVEERVEGRPRLSHALALAERGIL